MMSADELVCVATFDKVTEAHLCRSQLEAEGIRAVLENEHTVNANWLWNNAIGGIRLHVAAKDREAALQVLERGRRIFHLDRENSRASAAGVSDSPPKLEDVVSRDAFKDIEDEDDGPLESQREAHAKRALMFAIAGMFICPLQIFTIWVVWEVATMHGPLRPLYRFYCAGAGMIAFPYLAIPVLWAIALALNL